MQKKEKIKQPSNKMFKDMTTGNVTRHLIHFFLPLMAGYVFQQLYNVVDSVVIGRVNGANTLAAVGMVGSISYLFFALCEGLGGGIGIQVAQYFGAGRDEDVKRTIANGVYITVGAGMFMSLLALILARPVLVLMNTPAESFPDALIYMRIVCGASIVVAIYGTIAHIMRALGDSKTPLLFLIVASVTNIILDLVFVYGMKLGAAGVAWATVIAQFISALGSLAVGYKRNPYFHLRKEHFSYNRIIIKKSFSMGIPLAMQNAMSSLSGMTIQFVVNGYGAMVMAAYTASNRIREIARLPMGVLGTAVANFSGQNAGAGFYDRVKSGIIKSVWMVTIYGSIGTLILFLFGNLWIGFFVDEAEVIAIGTQGLRISCLFLVISGLTNMFKAALNGVGDAAFTMINGIIEIIACMICAFTLTKIPFLGMKGIWCTSGVACLIAGLACLYRLVKGTWKKKGIND